MKTVILSLGGSLIVPGKVDVEFLSGFKKIIEEFTEKARIVIVCGGGSLAREYQNAISMISKASDEDKDMIGISATHHNARLVRLIFGQKAFEKIIIDPNMNAPTEKRVIVAGGWKPGFSSDMDAVLLAKQFNADTVVNMSNTDYVYDKDPKKHNDAKPLKELKWNDFFKIVGEKWKPGLNAPFDPIASREAEKNKIKAIIIGKNLDNLKNVLNNKPYVGTTIS